MVFIYKSACFIFLSAGYVAANIAGLSLYQIYRLGDSTDPAPFIQRFQSHANALMKNPQCEQFSKHTFIASEFPDGSGENSAGLWGLDFDSDGLQVSLAADCFAALMIPSESENRVPLQLGKVLLNMDCYYDASCMQRVDNFLDMTLVKYALYAPDPKLAIRLLQVYKLRTAEDFYRIIMATAVTTNNEAIYREAILSARFRISPAQIDETLMNALRITDENSKKTLFLAALPYFGPHQFPGTLYKELLTSDAYTPGFLRWAILTFLDYEFPSFIQIKRILQADPESPILILGSTAVPPIIQNEVMSLSALSLKYQIANPKYYREILRIQQELNAEFSSLEKAKVFEYLATSHLNLIQIAVDFFDPNRKGIELNIANIIFDEKFPQESRDFIRYLYGV